MLLLRLAMRNALRSPARSGLTALTVLLGTALLTVALAWVGGVFAQMLSTSSDAIGHVRIVQPGYALREEMLPLYENLPDVQAVAAEVRELPGVVEVVPKVSTGVTLTVGEEIGDVFALAVGAPPEWLSERLGLAEALAEGRLVQDRGDVVLGATAARQAGAKVGDEVVLLGQTQDGSISPIQGTVVGIVAAGNGLIDQGAYVPLADLQYLADLEGGATELLVYTDHRDRAVRLASDLRALPGLQDLEVEAWSHRDPWVQFLPLMGAIRGILQAVIVFITALGVWNTMLMSVLERTDEIGVLRAMGLTRAGTVVMFTTEALAIAIVGGGLGVGLGSLGAAYLETVGLRLGDVVAQNLEMPIQSTMYADLNGEVVATAFVLGLCMALLGSALPSLRAALIDPVQAMRQI